MRRARARRAGMDRQMRARGPWSAGAASAFTQGAEDIARVQREIAGGAVGKEKAQRLPDRRKRDLVPRNFAFLEKTHFETFLAGIDFDVEQPRQIEQMHLMHVRHVEQREKALNLDA